MLKHTPYPRLAIIGAGPAGLSLARFLNGRGGIAVTVFEAKGQVGGKSWTFREGDAVCEMGTCYATRADRHVRAWIRELDLGTRRLGASSVDGTDYFDWARDAPGAPLSLQVLHYLWAAARLRRAVRARPEDERVRAEAAQPILYWLRERKLTKMERLHYRALTNMGYGALDETPAIQAVRWVDLSLIVSGRLNDLVMPAIGWTPLWQRLSEDLDVRLNSPVTAVERTANGVRLTAAGQVHDFDKVVCAIPLDDFAALGDPTESESWINRHVRWNRYATTLLAVDDWFTEENVRSFEAGITLGAPAGRLMSARHEAYSSELGGHLYVLNQLGGDYTGPELAEIAMAEIRNDGGRPKAVILQKLWKYFAQYTPEGVRAGLLQRLEAMQGEANTWYTGATFSHEAVSKITAFNESLAERIAVEVNAQQADLR